MAVLMRTKQFKSVDDDGTKVKVERNCNLLNKLAIIRNSQMKCYFYKEHVTPLLTVMGM
jgi:hypothetical protein